MDPDALTIQPRPADMPHNTRAVDASLDCPTCGAQPHRQFGDRLRCSSCGRDNSVMCSTPENNWNLAAPPQDAGAGYTDLDLRITDALNAAEKVIAQLTRERDEASAYTITLQRIIEAVCNGAALPSDAAEKAPHHAEMVSEYRTRSERAREELPPAKAWLIEGDGRYWDGTGTGEGAFTTKHHEAVRFARCVDADRVKHWLLGRFAFALRTSEHVWLDNPSAPSTPGEEKAG